MTIDFEKLLQLAKDQPLVVLIFIIFVAALVINTFVKRNDAETKAYLNAIDQQARSYNRLDDTVKLLQGRVDVLEKERDALREQNLRIQIEADRKIASLEDKIDDLERELKQYKEEKT